jgi:hypothetical protein
LRALNSKLSVGFHAWKENVAEVVRCDQVVNRAVKIMKNHLSARAFRAWASLSIVSSRGRLLSRCIVQAKIELLHALGLGVEPELASLSTVSDLNEVNIACEALITRINASQPFSSANSINTAFRAPKAFELVTMADVAALRELFKSDSSPVWYTVRKLLRTAQFFGVDHTMSLLVQTSNQIVTNRSISPSLFDEREVDYEESKEGQGFISKSLDWMVKNNTVIMNNEDSFSKSNVTRVGTREDIQFFQEFVNHTFRNSPLFPLLPTRLTERMKNNEDLKTRASTGLIINEKEHVIGVKKGKE